MLPMFALDGGFVRACDWRMVMMEQTMVTRLQELQGWQRLFGVGEWVCFCFCFCFLLACMMDLSLWRLQGFSMRAVAIWHFGTAGFSNLLVLTTSLLMDQWLLWPQRQRGL